MTLSKIPLQFNSKIDVSHTGGTLTSDSGLVLVQEFINKTHLDQLLAQVPFNDQRKYWQHSNGQLLHQWLLQLIAGYRADCAANQLAKDPGFQLCLPQVAQQSSLSALLKRATPATLAGMRCANQALLDLGRRQTNQQTLILDLDSTYYEAFGHQEGVAYNSHYGCWGQHPIVAFDGQTGDFLEVKLRPGNVYTSTGVVDFIRPLIEHYQQSVPVTDLFCRADSGFATPELYDFCEAQAMNYVIRLKTNAVLERQAEARIQYDDHSWDQPQTVYFELTYQAQSWPTARRVCVEAKLTPGQLLFDYTFVITNLSSAVPAAAVFQIYRRRGTMENFIKEAKTGFAMDKTDSATLLKNELRTLMSELAYNVVNLMRRLTFPKAQQAFRIETIRKYLLKVAGKVVHTARRIQLKLSATHVYQGLFKRILLNIQQL